MANGHWPLAIGQGSFSDFFGHFSTFFGMVPGVFRDRQGVILDHSKSLPGHFRRLFFRLFPTFPEVVPHHFLSILHWFPGLGEDFFFFGPYGPLGAPWAPRGPYIELPRPPASPLARGWIDPRCQFGCSKIQYLSIPNSNNQFSESKNQFAKYKKQFFNIPTGKLASDGLI